MLGIQRFQGIKKLEFLRYSFSRKGGLTSDAQRFFFAEYKNTNNVPILFVGYLSNSLYHHTVLDGFFLSAIGIGS